VQNGGATAAKLVRGFVKASAVVPHWAREATVIFVKTNRSGSAQLRHEDYLARVHGEMLDHVINRCEHRRVASLNR
jgi:hypothetical protein